MEPEGRLTLPQEIQQILNLESGDRLILTLEDNGTLQLVSLKNQVKKLRGLLSSHAKLITCPIELKPLRGNDRHV
ncbi:AbrB/MazE/SpoVT family DNA-binding domain-containing protein [Microcystis panniformis]|uniref:AbrB/MazE/SpoVT family DNA-binding domain-containing protein n=1 Tax=Microcystis panniformis TaxID=513223 RepID=UPI003F8C0A9A